MPTPDDRPEMDAAEQRQMARRHVFAINGAPAFLDLLRELLQDERYNVTTTNFVPATFAQIAALGPDLLIVDLAVGERAGWDLLERLAAEAATRGIPVVVSSTDPRLLDRARAGAARWGGDRFLVKPFYPAELLRTIRELIGEA
jgi:DNA-binding response OmpR family regulator